MNTSDRADLHRMATQIALSYARCHNETFDAFPALFQTAYHGLLSCTQPMAQEQARPVKKAGTWLDDLDGQHEQARPSTEEWSGFKKRSWPSSVKLRINKGTQTRFAVLNRH